MYDILFISPGSLLIKTKPVRLAIFEPLFKILSNLPNLPCLHATQIWHFMDILWIKLDRNFAGGKSRNTCFLNGPNRQLARSFIKTQNFPGFFIFSVFLDVRPGNFLIDVKVRINLHRLHHLKTNLLTELIIDEVTYQIKFATIFSKIYII